MTAMQKHETAVQLWQETDFRDRLMASSRGQAQSVRVPGDRRGRNRMVEIIDLAPEYEATYCACLEDWSDEMKEAGDAKKLWLERKKQEGLRVRLARNEKGEIVGMVQYAPIEKAPAIGHGLYYIYCIWVHSYKKGVGDWRGQGIGRKLLQAAEDDARALGASGMAAWGILLPFFIRSKYYKKHGYVRADREGMLELVWKPFSKDAEAPGLLRRKRKPEAEPGTTSIACFRNGWCPAMNLACERAMRVAKEFPGKTTVRLIETDNPEALEEWGTSDALYIDGKEIQTGPPPATAKLRKIVAKSVARRN